MRMKIVAALAALCAAASGSSAERGATAPEAVTDRLRTVLAERFPGIEVLQIQSSADLPGMYEVLTAEEVVYMDAGGKRLVVGGVMDLDTRENLSEKAWNRHNAVDFAALPFDKAIRFVKGSGSRRMAVFADPFCPFCRELEKTLAGMNDITVDVFLYPLEVLHPGATNAAEDIWCAADRAAAWSTWMLENKAPARQQCTGTPVASLVELGKKLRIRSTPTVFFADGARLPGTADAAALEARLSQAQRVRPATE
jgi:thiol:disulfide interchange protein DsbC